MVPLATEAPLDPELAAELLLEPDEADEPEEPREPDELEEEPLEEPREPPLLDAPPLLDLLLSTTSPSP